MKRLVFFLLGLFLIGTDSVSAQSPVSSSGDYQTDGERVFDVVEQMPMFPGGQSALSSWIRSNIQYPKEAEADGVVVCMFVVERDGSISNVKVVRSIDPLLDKEAVRVVQRMPKWIPGKQSGSAVRVKYTLPVPFRLQ